MNHAIILSAGMGKRMKSELPKGAFIIIDKPMVVHEVDILNKAGIFDIVVIVGHLKEVIEDILKDHDVIFRTQELQNGTASATLAAKDYLIGKEGSTLIIPSDMPLISSNLIKDLFIEHEKRGDDLTVLTASLNDPFSYGRIIKDKDGNLERIVEEADATTEEKLIQEVNSGLILVKNSLLFQELSKVQNKNVKGEYYLTDLIEIMKKDGYIVSSYMTKDSSDIYGVNDRYHLSVAEKTLEDRIKRELMEEGITIRYPESVMIGEDVVIGEDVTIEPNTLIYGKSVIGDESIIGPNTEIDNTIIGKNVRVNHSLIKNSQVMDNSTVGPFAHLRDGAIIGPSNRIGNFVEIKNSSTKENTKASHLSYIGDATVGANVNFGCGAITVNYDGKNKWKSRIGDNAFIGSNSNLIAPINIQDNAYIACGSTVNHNVPEGALVIARALQITKEGYAEKLRKRAQEKSKDKEKVEEEALMASSNK